MFTVVIEKFENLRHLVHARLLSSEYHDLRNVVKEHVAADVWKTYCITDDNTASNITYSLLRHWHLTIEDLSVAAAENESGSVAIDTEANIILFPYVSSDRQLQTKCHQDVKGRCKQSALSTNNLLEPVFGKK